MTATTTSFEILTGPDAAPEFIDNTLWNYTNFQVEFMLEVQDRDMFERFVTHGHHVGQLNGRTRKAGSVSVLWYEDGVLNGTYLGKDEIRTSVVKVIDNTKD